MAVNNPNTATTVSEQDIDDLQELLSDLKRRAREAHDAGNVIMNNVYAELVKLVSPEVQRFRARLDREEKAVINRQLKELRQSQRASASNGAQP